MFVDYISLFLKVKDKACSDIQLNNDQNKIIKWLFKEVFFLILTQALQICFSHKRYNEIYPH